MVTKFRLQNKKRLMAACLSASMLMMAASPLALAQAQQNFNQQPVSAASPAAPIQDAPATGQQLPDGFAQQQIPNALSLNDEELVPAQSDQIIPAQNAAVSNDVNQQPQQIPAEPTTSNLVPATPMGAAARGAANPQEQQSGVQRNSVEDAADAADREIEMKRQQAATTPSSVLDEWQSSAAQNENDDLPQVNNTTMVRLETDGFNNAATRNVSVTMAGEPSLEDQKTLQEGIRKDAFDAAITGMFPLTPGQIKTLLGKYDETQKAVEEPVYAAPKPEISVTNISLDPGVMPPTIKTAVGNVTTVNILDATGAPWPVQDVTWAGDFEIVEPEEGGHIIRITPMAQHARGNIVIRLLTLKTPLTMTLETGRDIVQYRVDARVPEYGPFANAPLMQGGKSLVAGDSTLTTLLDGVAPSGAMKLAVSGVDGRTTAYSKGGQTFVRTPLTLLSPAWQSSVTSADGMNVYVLSSAPVLLLSDEGEFMRASLQEKEDLLDE